MADDADDASKTEDPSGKRLSEAAAKGQVAKSHEVTVWMTLAGVMLIVLTFGTWIANGVARAVLPFIEAPHKIAVDPLHLRIVFMNALGDVAPYMLLVFGIMVVMGILSHVIQHPISLATEKLAPTLERISPLAGLKRQFSISSVVEFLKGNLKIAIVGVAIFFAILPDISQMTALVTYEPLQILLKTHVLTIRILGIVLAIMFVIGGADWFYQRWEYMKSLRMTKQEVKDEYKEQEGDPVVKGRIKALRQQRARQRMMAAVPAADVVVTNPTHFAVALSYKPEEMAAPKLVAKGADLLAKRIREIAEEHDVPIVENPPLARALHAAVELDAFIPPEHYKAVAEVISYVFRLNGKMPAARADG